jgi:hypothetical protein
LEIAVVLFTVACMRLTAAAQWARRKPMRVYLEHF